MFADQPTRSVSLKGVRPARSDHFPHSSVAETQMAKSRFTCLLICQAEDLIPPIFPFESVLGWYGPWSYHLVSVIRVDLDEGNDPLTIA